MTSNTAFHPRRLAGRTAIVTGATSGIGQAIAIRLAAEGANVVVSGRDTGRGSAVVQQIGDTGGTAQFLPADLAGSYAELRDFARTAAAALDGSVDILVNNAGVYPVAATDQLPDDALDLLLAVNIRAPHVLVAELAPQMVQRGRGAIINIGSWMARIGTPSGAAYTASKAAIEQLSRNWAAEYGKQGVRVNTVAPGVTRTPGNEHSAQLRDAMAKNTPATVPVEPADIAAAVAYLASDEAIHLHGTTLRVDGGITSVIFA